jgi:hypothetical protein
MDATVPVWVLLVVAVAGLVTTIAATVLTQWYASRREDVVGLEYTIRAVTYVLG